MGKTVCVGTMRVQFLFRFCVELCSLRRAPFCCLVFSKIRRFQGVPVMFNQECSTVPLPVDMRQEHEAAYLRLVCFRILCHFSLQNTDGATKKPNTKFASPPQPPRPPLESLPQSPPPDTQPHAQPQAPPQSYGHRRRRPVVEKSCTWRVERTDRG